MKPILVSIVEDNSDISAGLQRIIDDTAELACISTYSSAEVALISLPELQPDIVIMDIGLPGMSGVDCLRNLKLRFPRMQFIMFTINEDCEQIFEALSSGATGYLLKNTPHSEIPAALKELYEGGAPMSAGIAKKVVTMLQQKATPARPANNLSGREFEILHCLSRGFLYKEVAERLGITTGTVRQHIHRIYEKLHVQNRTEALNKIFGRSSH